MRKRHLHLLIVSALFIGALTIISANFPGAALFAQQPENNSTPSTSSTPQQNGSTSTQGQNQNQNQNQSSTYGQGTTGSTYGQNQTPAQTGQSGTAGANNGLYPGSVDEAATDVDRAGAPWGWMILSFIVGLAVGALVFRNRSAVRVQHRDQDDYRRSA
jgi:hypothetical protein